MTEVYPLPSPVNESRETNLANDFEAEPRFGDFGNYNVSDDVLEMYDVIRGIKFWPHRAVCMATLRHELLPQFPLDVCWRQGMEDHFKETCKTLLSLASGVQFNRFVLGLTLYESLVQPNADIVSEPAEIDEQSLLELQYETFSQMTRAAILKKMPDASETRQKALVDKLWEKFLARHADQNE